MGNPALVGQGREKIVRYLLGQFLKGLFIGFEGFCLFSDAQDFHGVHYVALYDRIDYVLAFDDMAKHSMFAIQVRCRHMSDEKLAAVGGWPCISHTQDSGLVMLQ